MSELNQSVLRELATSARTDIIAVPEEGQRIESVINSDTVGLTNGMVMSDDGEEVASGIIGNGQITKSTDNLFPSGAISLGQLNSTFGGSKMSQLYRGGSGVPDCQYNNSVPTSGTIKFSDFYGKKLNIVVNYYTGGTENQPQNGYQRYQANNVTVIGGFRGRKEAGSKILIHVNKIIGSAKGNQANVALRTGTWNSDVVLSVDVGSSGRLYGAGGDGGQGADSWSDGGSTNGGSGGNGTSALGIEHEETAVNVQSGGKINAGAPGGGGGAGARQVDSGADRSACGGGGGGGAGLPAGSGGRGGVRQSGNPDEVQNGNGGSAGSALYLRNNTNRTNGNAKTIKLDISNNSLIAGGGGGGGGGNSGNISGTQICRVGSSSNHTSNSWRRSCPSSCRPCNHGVDDISEDMVDFLRATIYYAPWNYNCSNISYVGGNNPNRRSGGAGGAGAGSNRTNDTRWK